MTAAGDVLAMNFLMDRDAEHWARDLAGLKAQVGTCDTSAPIAPTARSRAISPGPARAAACRESVLLAPTPTPRIQSLSLTRATP